MAARARWGASAPALLSAVALIAAMQPSSATTADSASHPYDAEDLVASLGISAPAQRAAGVVSSERVAGTGAAAPTTKAEIEDLSQYAKQSGESLDALIAKHVGVTEFDSAATALETEFAGTFVTASLTDHGPAVLFTKQPPKAVTDKLSTLPVDVTVGWGASATAAEVSIFSGTLLTSLGKRFPGISGTAGYNGDATEIAVDIALPNDVTLADKATSDRLAAALSGALVDATATTVDGKVPAPLRVRELPVAPTPTMTVEGGVTLTSGANLSCTTGFTAVRSGQYGVITAQHCPNNEQYNGWSGIITFVTPATGTGSGAIDLDFYRVTNGNDTSPTFYWSGSQKRTVQSVSNPANGQTVCKNGWAGGYGCTVIDQRDICVYYSSGATYCGLDRGNSDVMTGGDSGGPAFYTSTAHGINAAEAAGYYSFFTRIGRVANNLDASVRVG